MLFITKELGGPWKQGWVWRYLVREDSGKMQVGGRNEYSIFDEKTEGVARPVPPENSNPKGKCSGKGPGQQ